MYKDILNEAITIASRYAWDTPNVIDYLKKGIIPDGFGNEIGQTIALFLSKPVISYAYWGIWSYDKEQAYNQQMRNHGLCLVRLRILIAFLRRDIAWTKTL